ncbi:hypothetical protein I601_1637 [Nocardioides dokdonensis FR1436]|uniref:Uncharacterized protein n=1 Tax=Nocardioides dokdonensis FR1436 TaxID=1300347 RepID=A0A1A9GIC3_9ACTN|nr:GerMN domain-containing protein [Nocardioides dokdonensis]ANH38069.1 hypothetical protein I601_1637 [Nocardioides dokdonensis FR1436]
MSSTRSTTPQPATARSLPRLAASAATVLALTAGGLAVTAGGATAETAPRISSAAVAGTSLDHAGERRATTCADAKSDVRKAKKSLRKAKKAKTNKAKKVKRAKKRVKNRKNRRNKLCSDTGSNPGQVQDQIDQDQDLLGALPLGSLGALLPAELAGQLNAVTAQLQGLLSGLESQVPGADAGQLTEILAALQAMDVQAFSAAVQALLEQLSSGGADPEAVTAVLTTLLGGLPGGSSIPGADLGQLSGALSTLQAALSGFDPSMGPAAFATALQQLVASLTALGGQVEGTPLAPLLELFSQLEGLGAFSAGDPTEIFAGVLEALLSELGSADFLDQLSEVLSTGGLGGLLGSLGDLLDDILGGLLGGLLGGIFGGGGLPFPKSTV